MLGWLMVAQFFTFSPFLVEGPSMEPTLHDGTLFVVDNGGYRLRDPERGDIVVFTLEGKPDYFYVKRIVGLPGERIAIKQDGLYVAEEGVLVKIDEPYLTDIADSDKQVYSYKPRFAQYYTVPYDTYFVLGDNRLHSLDSRYFKDPFIPIEQIQGKYFLTLLKK